MKVTKNNSHYILDNGIEKYVLTNKETKDLFEKLEDELWEPEESHRWLDSEVTRLRLKNMELQSRLDDYEDDYEEEI